MKPQRIVETPRIPFGHGFEKTIDALRRSAARHDTAIDRRDVLRLAQTIEELVAEIDRKMEISGRDVRSSHETQRRLFAERKNVREARLCGRADGLFLGRLQGAAFVVCAAAVTAVLAVVL